MGNRSFAMKTAPADAGVRKFATHRGGMAVAALFGSLAFAAGAPAAEEETRANTFEITPFFGQMLGGSFEDPTDSSDRDLESDTNFGIFLNLSADPPERQYELFYTKQSTVVEGTVPIDLDVEYLQIGGTVGYPQHPHVIPYFGATFGATQFSPDAAGLDDETKISVTVGGGVRFPITDHIGVRLDIRSFITFLENDSEIFCVSVPANASCLIKPSSDTFVQYNASLGFSVGF
jgi:opacity protein-like surface antigen